MGSLMRSTSQAIGCLALLAISGLARGELLYFVRGGQAQLPATIEGKTVRLDTPDGPRSFPIEDFLAIVPGHDPEAEWPERREAASKAGTVEARFAALWWALENGLTHQAISMLNGSRPIALRHGPTLRCLASLDALAPPCPDPDLESLRLRLRPARFREIRGDHVLLLHQATESEARERLELLERVVATFYLTLAAQGIELTPPRERLISVWFADQRDYIRFLRRAEAEPFIDTQGYYHPTMRVVFAFDTRSTEAQRTGRRAIANRGKEGAAESDLARRTLLIDLEWRAVDLGIAAHETVHQVEVASGFSPRLDDFPSWLHEGFASQFEVVRGGRWAGVGRVHDLRLPDWRAIRPEPRLAPLLRDVGIGHGYQRDRYAESWALVYFLRKTRPAEFRTFLDLLRAPSTDSSARPDRAVEAFRSAFGNDVARLESDWRGYLEGLKTPLESGRPEALGRESRLARPVPDH
jgi:Protein of unknown function (DUF1570)